MLLFMIEKYRHSYLVLATLKSFCVEMETHLLLLLTLPIMGYSCTASQMGVVPSSLY